MQFPFFKKSQQPNHVVTFLQGVALGVAEVIPGVSGSTIALLLGIYDDFIDVLYQGSELVKVIALLLIGKKNFKDVRKQISAIRWTFGIVLFLGMLLSVVGLSQVIISLVANYPTYLFAVLFGLTIPTMMIVYKQMKKPAIREWIIAGITASAFLALFVVSGETINVTQPHPLHLFFGGMLAVSTMVLPGVSGSFMLLVLGLYNFVIGLVAKLSDGSVDTQTLTSLGILIAGMATGFLTTVRLLKKAFSSYRNQLMAFLLGLLLSSWYVLWPFVEVLGFDHDAPILTKVSPLTMELPHIALIILLVAVTAAATSWLHAWADTQDRTSSKKDQGFDKI